jgi:hypothetical protein
VSSLARRTATAFLAAISLLVSQWVVAMNACAWMDGAPTPQASTVHQAAGHCPEHSPAPSCERHCNAGDVAPDCAKTLPVFDVTHAPPMRIALPAPRGQYARMHPRQLPPDPPASIRFSVLRI